MRMLGIPGRATCKVTQVGSLTEKWHIKLFEPINETK